MWGEARREDDRSVDICALSYLALAFFSRSRSAGLCFALLVPFDTNAAPPATSAASAAFPAPCNAPTGAVVLSPAAAAAAAAVC